MFSPFEDLAAKFFKKKVYALVGRSGTGKSFRAQLVAAKYHIPLIVDDGLIIKKDKILAGRSAKQEPNFLSAVKCAVFQDPDHRQEALEVLAAEKFHKILIIGTSEKMTAKIAAVLTLPDPEVIINIEDIATRDEIDTAMRIRYSEGKHVIPVPPLQVTRSYPLIVYDSIRVGLQKRFPILRSRRSKVSERTLVRPEFSKIEQSQISVAAIRQMVTQCLYEYENTMKIEQVSCTSGTEGYDLEISIRTPVHIDAAQIPELREYISDSLEKYGGILINNVHLNIHEWV